MIPQYYKRAQSGRNPQFNVIRNVAPPTISTERMTAVATPINDQQRIEGLKSMVVQSFLGAMANFNNMPNQGNIDILRNVLSDMRNAGYNNNEIKNSVEYTYNNVGCTSTEGTIAREANRYFARPHGKYTQVASILCAFGLMEKTNGKYRPTTTATMRV